MAHKPLNLGAAIMQPGRQASAAGNVVALGETPMILTLDQLRPNPDNPRTTRNPRYDDIKNSIHARGKRLARTVLIFTERSDQLSRATDRVPGLPASPGYAQ